VAKIFIMNNVDEAWHRDLRSPLTSYTGFSAKELIEHLYLQEAYTKRKPLTSSTDTKRWHHVPTS